MSKPAVLLTDADNTLWDTNQVFADAQMELLERVESLAGRTAPDSDRLDFIRRFDQAIAARDHRGLKYPPILLVRELWHSISERSLSAFDESRAGEIVSNFFAALRRRPRLRAGVRLGIDMMVENDVDIWVVSEGHREIVSRALADHGLDRAVSRVFTAQKTVGLYKRLARMIPEHARSICVGDQLDRDIEPAKRAGLKTAYFPSDFRPDWTDDKMVEYADAVIADYRDLVGFLIDRTASSQQAAR